MIARASRPRALSTIPIGVAAVALACVLAACPQDRSPIGTSAVGAAAGPAAGGVTDPVAGAGGSQAGGGGLGPVPDVADCACLAGAADEDCRECLEDVAPCADLVAACEAAEPGYCALVLDCAGLCPVADARCIDVCLGAESDARTAAAALAACACEACAGDCGEDGC